MSKRKGVTEHSRGESVEEPASIAELVQHSIRRYQDQTEICQVVGDSGQACTTSLFLRRETVPRRSAPAQTNLPGEIHSLLSRAADEEPGRREASLKTDKDSGEANVIDDEEERQRYWREVEQRRLSSRLSSRRSQERKRKRIDYLTSEEDRAKAANDKLKTDNKELRQAIETLKASKALRVQAFTSTASAGRLLPEIHASRGLPNEQLLFDRLRGIPQQGLPDPTKDVIPVMLHNVLGGATQQMSPLTQILSQQTRTSLPPQHAPLYDLFVQQSHSSGTRSLQQVRGLQSSALSAILRAHQTQDAPIDVHRLLAQVLSSSRGRPPSMSQASVHLGEARHLSQLPGAGEGQQANHNTQAGLLSQLLGASDGQQNHPLSSHTILGSILAQQSGLSLAGSSNLQHQLQELLNRRSEDPADPDESAKKTQGR